LPGCRKLFQLVVRSPNPIRRAYPEGRIKERIQASKCSLAFFLGEMPCLYVFNPGINSWRLRLSVPHSVDVSEMYYAMGTPEKTIHCGRRKLDTHLSSGGVRVRIETHITRRTLPQSIFNQIGGNILTSSDN